MSKKYIAQVNSNNFVFPNSTLAEYDVQIYHNLDESSVSGTTTGFDISLSGSDLYASFTYQWHLNNAEPFISQDGKLNIISLHIQTPDKQYFKPWICVGLIQRDNTSLTYVTDTQNFIITPAMAGVSSFVGGTYYFEIRMMGKRAVYPINVTDTLVGPTPTPTPTASPSPTPGLSPTPTPTPSGTPGGGGGSYRYYLIDKYNCFPCSLNSTGLIGRVSYPTTLTNGYYYNNGDGFVYLVDTEIASTGWTVDLDFSASSGTNCAGTCSI